MGRQRPSLGTPFGADGPWLAALVDALGDIYDLLDGRLPAPNGCGEPRQVEEPTPQAPPAEAAPIAEPAPVVTPKTTPDDDKDERKGGPVKMAEPAPAPPPRAGRGSSLPAWRAWAELRGVAVDDGMTRDDIIAACEHAGVLEARE